MTEPLFLLDSNICIYVLKGQGSRLRSRIEQRQPGEIVTSSIVYAEVMRGIPAADHERASLAERFFQQFPPLDFDRACGAAYRFVPFKRGKFDRLIAAHALAKGLTIVTSDETDFADVPGLKVENWTL